MTTSENTSAIDEKKAEENGTTTNSPDFKGFVSNYLSSIIFTIGVAIFIIGGFGLYTTKVAQSNILPDNIELTPYTVVERIVKDVKIDINVMRPSIFTENKDTLSQKAIFNTQEYLDSFNKSFLCSLKKAADPTGGLFANAPLFFSNVYDNIIAKNFLAINTIFFYLSYLPESIIMILYGIFGIFIWIGLYFFNVCIGIFYHIIHIPQLFRTTDEDNDKQWESIDKISFLRFMKLVVFFFIWIPVGALSTFFMPIFFTLYGLISPLYATYNIKQSSNQTKKTFNIIDFIKDTFAYKQFFFFVLATLSLFSNGIKYLGNNAVVGLLVAVIFAYFMGLYTNEMPQVNINGFSYKINQNVIQASVIDVKTNNPQLVEICSQIPVVDEKMKKIINKGTFRQLTKPKVVGGELNDEILNEEMLNEEMLNEEMLNEEMLNEKMLNEEMSNNTTPDNIDTIQTNNNTNNNTNDTKLNLSKNNLQTLNNNLKLINNENTSYDNLNEDDYDKLINNLKQQINEIQKEIQNTEQNTEQTGGNYKPHKRKYNIKWT